MELTRKIFDDVIKDWGCASVKMLTTEGDKIKALVFEDGGVYRVSVNPRIVQHIVEPCSGAFYHKKIGKFYITPWRYVDMHDGDGAMCVLFSMLAEVEV